MAYILRSLAVVGVIALNSPVHGGKPTDGGLIENARQVAHAATQIDPRHAAQSLTAARETAQIIAGLDPETRQRLTALVIKAATGPAEKPLR
jgi:hypothetical protein